VWGQPFEAAAGFQPAIILERSPMALFFLLLVFLFVVLLIAFFIFPPTRWVKSMTKNNKK